MWHPDLTDEEVRFLQFVNAGQALAAKRLAAEAEAGGDFLSVILRARGSEVPPEEVWGHRVVDD